MERRKKNRKDIKKTKLMEKKITSEFNLSRFTLIFLNFSCINDKLVRNCPRTKNVLRTKRDRREGGSECDKGSSVRLVGQNQG